MQSLKIKAEDVHVRDEDWELVEITADFRRFRAPYGFTPEGNAIWIYKSEILAPDDFLEQNKAERNETEGTKWSQGWGSDKNGNMPLIKIGSVPLNIFFRDFVPRLQEGDTDYVKWFYNQDENQPFRTRKGKL